MRRLVSFLMQAVVSPVWLLGLLAEPLAVAYWTGRNLARRFVVWALVDPDEQKRQRDAVVEATKRQFPGCHVYYSEIQNAIVVEKLGDGMDKEKH